MGELVAFFAPIYAVMCCYLYLHRT